MHPLERMAETAGGQGRFFSQGAKRLEIARAQTTFQPEDLGGNCQALCLKWMRNKAGAKSLLDKLSVSSADVLVHKWRKIEALQGNAQPRVERKSAYQYMTGKGFTATPDPDMQLAVDVGTATPELAALTRRTGDTTMLCSYIANPFGARATVYKFVTYSPSGMIDEVGHACAAILDEDDIEFFDPNLGEYKLDRTVMFPIWWSGYLMFSGLGTTYKSYKVSEFGRDG
jgi:hypothetical protein